MRQKYEGKPRLFGAESAEEYGMARDNFASSIARWFFGSSSNTEKLNELKEQHDYEFSQPQRDASLLLESTQRELQEHKEVIAGLKETISSQKSSLSESTEALTEATGRISILTNQLHSVAESFGIDVTEGLEHLSDVSTEFSDVVEKIKACSAVLNESISSLSGTIAEHEETIQALNDKAGTYTEEIATLKSQVAELKSTIEVLNARDESVEMQALKVENERLRKELKERDGAISDYEAIIKRNNAKIHSLHRVLQSTLSPSAENRTNGIN